MRPTTLEGDFRERLTRLEMAEQYSHRTMVDQGNSLNRIGNNVIVNSNALTQMQGELNEIKPVVMRFQELETFFTTGRKVFVWVRGLINFLLAGAIMYAWFSGKITAENAKSLVKVAGLTG